MELDLIFTVSGCVWAVLSLGYLYLFYEQIMRVW